MKNPVKKLVGMAVNAVTNAVSQTSVSADGPVRVCAEEMKRLCRQAASDGAVLLKNEGGFFPVKPDETLAVFGRCQIDSFYVGYGSGGDVNPHYTVSFLEGLEANGQIRLNRDVAEYYRSWCKKNPPDNGFWGHWPMCYDEAPVPDELIAQAALQSDTAAIILGRAAGEDRENTLKPGSFYLTQAETALLRAVTDRFEKVAVVLNIGGIMDFSWADTFDPAALMIVWQGGMETGNAFADLVSGKTAPSGCLTDTIARRYEIIPPLPPSATVAATCTTRISTWATAGSRPLRKTR